MQPIIVQAIPEKTNKQAAQKNVVSVPSLLLPFGREMSKAPQLDGNIIANNASLICCFVRRVKLHSLPWEAIMQALVG